MEIFVLQKSCPLCSDDVKGNAYYGFFCKECNVLFRPEHVGMTKEKLARLAKKVEIRKIFSTPKDAVHSEDMPEFAEHETMDEKGKPVIRVKQAKPRSPVKEKEGPQVEWVASEKSTFVHVSSCLAARNIKKENKIVFASLDDAEEQDYDHCRCVKSLK